MSNFPYAFMACALLAVAAPRAVADWSGQVVKVQDGDSLTVLLGNKQVRVRLDAIDASS